MSPCFYREYLNFKLQLAQDQMPQVHFLGRENQKHGRLLTFKRSIYMDLQVEVMHLEKYVCYLYGQPPNLLSVNKAPYRMFTLGKCSEECLPQNSDSLHQHILRLNHEAYIRKQSTVNNIAVPSLNGFGWILEGNHLKIKWGTKESTLDSILEYVMCKCKKGCNTKRCSCEKANLPCSELCQWSECENMQGNLMEDGIIDYGLDENIDGTLHDEF